MLNIKEIFNIKDKMQYKQLALDIEEVQSMSFNDKAIIDIKEKLQSRQIQPDTEEATKQWLIMPLLVALGYDPYSSDIIPEYTLDVGTKRGEKVDYALQINNQPVAIVECKQLNVQLSDKYISQLYRYFTISNVHIAILSNGDDYWFFTDSIKENVMDLDPYYKIKLSQASIEDIEKLEQYSKGKIQYADISQVVQYERFKSKCKEFAHGLRTNNIPSWLLDKMAEICDIKDIDKPTLAELLNNEIQTEFDGYKIANKNKAGIKPNNNSSLGERMKATKDENRKNMSNIKLNHEYVYNDYSDGDWRYHSIEYAIILGTRYDNITARGLLLHTIEQLYKLDRIDRDKVLADKAFNGLFRITETGGFRGAVYIEGLDVYVGTSLGILDIIKFINKLLKLCNVPDNKVVISFKS